MPGSGGGWRMHCLFSFVSWNEQHLCVDLDEEVYEKSRGMWTPFLALFWLGTHLGSWRQAPHLQPPTKLNAPNQSALFSAHFFLAKSMCKTHSSLSSRACWKRSQNTCSQRLWAWSKTWPDPFWSAFRRCVCVMSWLQTSTNVDGGNPFTASQNNNQSQALVHALQEYIEKSHGHREPVVWCTTMDFLLIVYFLLPQRLLKDLHWMIMVLQAHNNQQQTDAYCQQ